MSVVVFTVPSIYFWRLKHVTPQGFLEGNPAFRAHGTVQASDGGVAFDGQTGFLTTDMSANDCVMNPALCPKGLSVGMNLKFDQSVKTYKEPRYLIDTGAQSSQTRGISIYVKDGKVFFTLAISQKVWEVSMKTSKALISISFPFPIFLPITPPPAKQCWFFYLKDYADHITYTALNWSGRGIRELTLDANKVV